jgi:hypothetical protein
VTEPTITYNDQPINKGAWTQEQIDRTLKNMADTTKAELERLSDEEAEDLATD